jgi:hypothetical protein
MHGAAGVDGPFVYSLQLVDVLTGRSERFAICCHKFDQMWQAIQTFKERCPICAREIHTDNGFEFINRAFVSQFGPEGLNAQLTRGRVGTKNDNRFVEEKNSSLIGAYLGNLYLVAATHRTLLNQLYEDMGLHYNLFSPWYARRRAASRRVTTV